MACRQNKPPFHQSREVATILNLGSFAPGAAFQMRKAGDIASGETSLGGNTGVFYAANKPTLAATVMANASWVVYRQTVEQARLLWRPAWW